MEKQNYKELLNLPNKISLIRIFLIPFIVLFSLLQLANLKNYNALWFSLIVLLLFVAASVTDFIDGRIARKTNQVTTFGKFLDTLADKLLVIVVLILIVSLYDDVYSTPLRAPFIFLDSYQQIFKIERNIKIFMIITVVIIVIREFLVTGLRQIAASKNIIVQADIFGKIKTFATLITIGFNLLVPLGILRVINSITKKGLSYANDIALSNLRYEGFVCFLWIVCLVLTVISAVNYFIKNKAVLFDTKEVNEENNKASKEVKKETNENKKKKSNVVDAEIVKEDKETTEDSNKKEVIYDAEIVENKENKKE